MRLFELTNNQPTITVECLLIPEFKALWDRDKTKDKSKAYNELRFIYFSTDFKSLYLAIDEEDRFEKLVDDFISIKNWKPDKLILDAINKYKEFQNTPTMRFLEDNQAAMESMGKYFRNIDWKEVNDKGTPIYSISQVSTAVKNAGAIIDNIEKLKDKVAKEQSLTNTVNRGGGTGGLMEFD